ncbi:hypothetical protein [Nonomuraea glycinis]|uniref:hypothetical protein n=1 Tax=Nonomuraea glycinis TaxID=2047744 RepID=UPI002E1210C4|nr:hypothetical protein OHA68_23270 [Nonomuraea glycinis]
MVWIAVAGVVAVIGVIVWSFRRDKRGADEPGGRSGWDWESRLGEDARVAFMEGVRACQDQAGPLAVNEERGLLRIVDPPRLISLYLLADRFTARGQDGLHDPQGVVRELVTQCVATEQPGVLHLRADWLSGEVDGMDGAGLMAAVGEIVCPEGASWSGDESAGCLEVALPGAAGEHADTALLDLGRVVERYEKTRAERPTMPAGALLRDVVFELISEAGPGLAWTRPPTERHRTALLATSRPTT